MYMIFRDRGVEEMARLARLESGLCSYGNVSWNVRARFSLFFGAIWNLARHRNTIRMQIM